MTTADAVIDTFFTGYRDALLARDPDRISEHYHCPALIAFPGNALAVTDPQQTRDFFAKGMDRYGAVHETTFTAVSLVATDASIWADVTWDYGAAVPGERFCYQLLRDGAQWRIGVLTPLG